MRKAREGKIIAGRQPDYGFKYNATRDGYDVDEETMRIVRRIFYMVGVEGRALHEIKKIFVAEGIPTPTGKKVWSTTPIRNFIGDDVYKPHTYQEVEKLVAPEVVARLDPECCYGIWWFNRRKTKTTQISINGRNDKQYKKHVKRTSRAREEWIAVPVPDSGVPRTWVDAARASLKDNHRNSNAGRRFWELSGGIMHCGGCDCAMVSHTTTVKSGSTYFYYACRTRYHRDRKACTQNKHFPAAKLEAQVWEVVSAILKDPEQLRADLDAMIEMERSNMHGNPDKEVELWSEKLAEVDHRRVRYQEMAADNLITFDELRAKLTELDDTRKTAERELEALRDHREYLDALEQDRDALLESLVDTAPDALDELIPEERRQVYKMLRLKVKTHLDGSLEVSGAFGEGFSICESETPSTRGFSKKRG